MYLIDILLVFILIEFFFYAAIFARTKKSTTLRGQYDTLSGLPAREKDYCQLVTHVTMLACKLIGEGQTLALRRTHANLPVVHELPPPPEGDSEAAEGEEQEEDEVPLVRKMRAPEAARGPDLERATSRAAAGSFG